MKVGFYMISRMKQTIIRYLKIWTKLYGTFTGIMIFIIVAGVWKSFHLPGSTSNWADFVIIALAIAYAAEICTICYTRRNLDKYKKFYCHRSILGKRKVISQKIAFLPVRNCNEIVKQYYYGGGFEIQWFRSGYYKTITHNFVIANLRRYEKKGIIQNLEVSKVVYTAGLTGMRKWLIGKKCSKCKKECQFRHDLDERIFKFHIVKFEIKQPNGGNRN